MTFAEDLRPGVCKSIVEALKSAPLQTMTISEIADALYGGRSDGGPLNAAKVIHVAIHYLRQCGFKIETIHGYRLK